MVKYGKTIPKLSLLPFLSRTENCHSDELPENKFFLERRITKTKTIKYLSPKLRLTRALTNQKW